MLFNKKIKFLLFFTDYAVNIKYNKGRQIVMLRESYIYWIRMNYVF